MMPANAERAGPIHPDVERIVYVTGSEYEQGYQHGYQLAKDIDLWSKFVRDYLSPVGTLESIKSHLDKYVENQTREAPEFIDHVKGIADGVKATGSTITFDDVKLLQWFWTLPHHPTIGCSSFGAWGRATKDGQPLYTQNIDTMAFPWAISSAIITHFPEKGHRWFTVGEPGKVVASSGMNSAGLVVALQYAPTYAPSESSYGLEGTQILYMVLKGCSTAEEAKNLVLRVPRAKGQIYILMDPSPKMFVVEATGNPAHAVVRESGSQGEIDFSVVTNHFASAKWAEWGYTAPAPPWGSEGPDDSWTRYHTVFKLVDDNLGRIDPSVAMSILSYHKYWDGTRWVDDASTGRSPCHHNLDRTGAVSADTAWMLYLPLCREFLVVCGNPCGNWPSDRLLGTEGHVRWVLGESPSAMEAQASADAASLIVNATDRLIRGQLHHERKEYLEAAKWHYFEGMVTHTNSKAAQAANEGMNSLVQLSLASNHFAHAQAYARYAMKEATR